MLLLNLQWLMFLSMLLQKINLTGLEHNLFWFRDRILGPVCSLILTKEIQSLELMVSSEVSLYTYALIPIAQDIETELIDQTRVTMATDRNVVMVD